jgi:virginiamycin B lyase
MAAVVVTAVLGTASALGAGAIQEFPTPDATSAPRGIVAGPDGALWFAESGAPGIGRSAPDGTLTEFPITGVNASPQQIAVGPDGDLWATDAFAGVVHRITPDGDITDVSLPTNAPTQGIAAGPDGALWVTLPSADRLARIVPDGAVTELPLPTAGAQPDGIAAGPDGALWFTQRGTGAIGRVTVDGTFSSFPIPAGGGSSPRGIVAGPDGALWFAEHDVGRAGRLDPATGAVTEVALGGGAQPLAIAVGGDGALWLTDDRPAGGLIRVTVAGGVSRTALPAGAGAPVGVAAGPDGAVWFTRSPDRVGRVGLLPAPVAGRVVDVAAVSGTVLIRRPGAHGFTRLPATGAAIPVGAEVDATRGTVRLTAAIGTATAASKTGDFSGGRFRVAQPRAATARLTVKLTGPLARCAPSRARAAAATATAARKPKHTPRKPKQRHVWGDAKGDFATSGNTAVATVRGTHWKVTDRCDGSTVVTVRTGIVAVTDTVRHRTVNVRAGHSLVVRPRRR